MVCDTGKGLHHRCCGAHFLLVLVWLVVCSVVVGESSGMVDRSG